MPKTNKERLQDNNTALLRIKSKAENLPDKLVNIVDGEVSGTTLILNSSVDLPYIPLEYIRSTGGQYIDTGILDDDSLTTLRINSAVTYKDNYNGLNPFIIASYNQNTYGFVAIYLDRRSHKITNYTSDQTAILGDWGLPETEAVQNIDITITSSNIIGEVNNTELDVNLTRTILHSNQNIYLFKQGNANTYYFNGLFFSMHIYYNTTLLRDFIPVKRKSDNEICLYDKVTNQFFTNQGTGTFIAGPEIS